MLSFIILRAFSGFIDMGFIVSSIATLKRFLSHVCFDKLVIVYVYTNNNGTTLTAAGSRQVLFNGTSRCHGKDEMWGFSLIGCRNRVNYVRRYYALNV